MKRYSMIMALMLLVSTMAAAQTTEDLPRIGGLSLKELKLAQGVNIRASNRDSTSSLQTGLQGTWWREQRWIRDLNLTEDQQKKMDDAFRQNRIKLIDLTATLEKSELMLEPLVENVKPGDDAKILAQIDEIANARAELEKTNARMLLAIRQVLTQEQWDKLPKTKSTIRYVQPPVPPVPPARPAPAPAPAVPH